MPDTKISIFASDGTTAAIDYRSEATNGDGRQVIVLGDPLLNNNVAAVATQDLPGTDQTTPGLVVRHAGSIVIGSGIVTSITNTIGINIGKVDGTIQVNIGKIDDSVKVVNVTGQTLSVNVGKIDDYVAIKSGSNSGTLGVYLSGTAGTVGVKLDPGAYAYVNAFHTANIFTTSGSSTGVSASGVTIISPSANASYKIFAFSLSSTAQSNMLAKFTNGAGTSPTEYWRLPMWAPAQGITGANLAVTPPGFLWATGALTTLALVMDTGSLIHYSVSYFKESA